MIKLTAAVLAVLCASTQAFKTIPLKKVPRRTQEEKYAYAKAFAKESVMLGGTHFSIVHDCRVNVFTTHTHTHLIHPLSPSSLTHLPHAHTHDRTHLSQNTNTRSLSDKTTNAHPPTHHRFR
jgi:hypothetical protein